MALEEAETFTQVPAELRQLFMRLYPWLAYLLSALGLNPTDWDCENETVRIVYGGTGGDSIRYRLHLGSFIENGVIAEGIAAQQ